MVKPLNGPIPAGRRYGVRRNWRTVFLAALAETSNVTAAAERAVISLSCVYRTRKEDPEFAGRWLVALCEGYDSLEMELLSRLRRGESRDGEDAETQAAGSRRFDNAAAIRLLSLHRANAARARALRENEDEQAVLDSIDAMIDEMRARGAANAAILASDEGDDDDAAG